MIMTLFIDPTGNVKGTIGTTRKPLPIDPESIGASTIKRQGVIMEVRGSFYADMFLAGGPLLGPFADRESTIQAEIDWLHANRF